MSTLALERKYLSDHKDELHKRYPGKFLVIKGEELSGAYDSINEALEAAATMHGIEDVLIRRTEEADLEISVPALTLGLTHASIPRSDSGSGENA